MSTPSSDPRLDLVRSRIRAVPDFPKPGILFRDITPLLCDGPAWRTAIELLEEVVVPLRPDVLIAVESRGFLFGAPLAEHLGIGLVPVRKPGKLPYKTDRVAYKLEYGEAELEMHVDSLQPGARVLIVDDLLATGGTASAAAALATRQGAQVIAYAFVVELDFIEGRQRLLENTAVPPAIYSLVHFAAGE